jgi:hypothetical protein
MSRFGERAGVAALTAFLVVDVLLVAYAINSTRQPVADGGTTITSSTVTTPRPSTSSTTAAPSVKVVPLTVGLVAVDGDSALRFSTGTCKDGGSVLELTTNAGKTWGPKAAPFDAIARLRVRPDGTAFVVGGNTSGECAPSIRQSESVDADFGDSSEVSDAWYRDLRSTGALGVPAGGSKKPCGGAAVVDLVVPDATAVVLCADGRLRSSESGAQWADEGKVVGALAIAVGSSGRVVGVVPSAGECDGLAVVDTAKPRTALGCVEVDVADVEPGTVAIATASGAGWLRVGDDTYRAGASLKTWKKS